MKAVYLLTCLALAHSSTASIFQRQYPRAQGLIEQPQDYISELQFAQEDQRTQYLENQRLQEDEYQRPLKSQQEQWSKKYNKKEQRPQFSQQWDQKYNQKEQRPQFSQQWDQKYNQKEQRPQFSQQWDQKSKYDQRDQSYQSYDRKNKKHQSFSSPQESYETKVNSQESMERMPINQYQKYVNRQPIKSQFPTNLNEKTQKEETRVQYGDAIAWKGLQMAVDPYSPITKEDIQEIYGDAQNAMKHITEEEKPQFHELFKVAAEKDNEDAHLNATELLKKYNYPVEEHIIRTDDGYILTLFRIPPVMQTREVQPRKVVFLMHGTAGSADDWLLMGPGKSLAYLLADQGYDVWLGNARGNKYSRQHVSKHSAVTDFWKFSNDEIALHDLPAMIDYVLEETHQPKLYYIGHSQGTTTFFALAATRPEYNDKIIMMYALSPMVYMTHVRSPLIRMVAPTSKFAEHFDEQLGHGEFKPKKELLHTLGGAMCENEINCKNVCSNVNFVMSGINVEGLDADLIPVILSHLPAGASTRMIKQYAQAMASHEFRKYDFGSDLNEKVYGTPQPPRYQIEEVKAPVSLYFSEEDWLAHPTDVQQLQKELPNVQELYQVPDEHFSHMDFQFSTKAPSVVYKHLIDSMDKQLATY